MINSITLIGRLTKDPTIKTTQSGVSVATFNLAVERNFRNPQGEKETDFIPVVAWRGLADTITKYCHKGNMLAISGRLQVRNYEDNKGIKRTIAEVIASDCQFLTTKNESERQQSFDEIEPLDDDIPF